MSKRRWRLESRPDLPLGTLQIRWGPWKTSVEVHQAYCQLTTDATVGNRIITLRHRNLAPNLVLADIPCASVGVAANVAIARITWGQGFNTLNVATTAAGDERVLTAFLPFAFIVNVGEVIEMVLAVNGATDQLVNPIIMVRDLDDIERGR